MKTFSFFLFLMMFPVLTWAEADFNYKGSLGFEQWSFPRKGFSAQNNANDTFEFKGEGSVNVGDWQVLAAPRLKADLVEERRNRITADEAWVQYSTENMEIRAGIQSFFWGTVESVNIVDVLNQRDYESDFLDPYKWGEFSTLISYFTDNYTFEFYYLPYFRTATFPSRYSRYSFTNSTVDISKNEKYHEGSRWDPQGAFRVTTTVGSADMAIALFHGWSRFPILNYGQGNIDLVPHYYKEDRISYEIQMAVDKWLLKGEVVYKNTDINGELVRPSILPGGRVINRSLIPDSYVSYVFGFEYTFERIVDSNDLTFLAEYLGDTNRGEKTPDYRVYQNDLFFGFRYNFNDADDKKLEFGGFLALERGDEFIYSVEYSQRFWENFNFNLKYMAVGVNNEDSPVSIFREDGRITTKVTWNF